MENDRQIDNQQTMNLLLIWLCYKNKMLQSENEKLQLINANLRLENANLRTENFDLKKVCYEKLCNEL